MWLQIAAGVVAGGVVLFALFGLIYNQAMKDKYGPNWTDHV